ncbi:MAG: ComEC/Rec2 family competence protein [Candidatus Saccharibacteria bacterium]
METGTKRIIKYLLCPLLIAAGLVGVAAREFKPDYLLHVSFYDVGQGDAALVRTFEGNQILIDGGPSDAILSRLGSDLPFYDRSIEAVILTHPHADHLSGLVDVLRRYRVRRILMPEFKDADSAAFREFLGTAQEKRVPIVFLKTGERVYLDDATVFDVLSPQGSVLGAVTDQSSGEGKGVNDGSLVGRLSFGQTRFLFEADAGANVESSLAGRYDLQADVLKVAHHGSAYASSSGFLAQVRPRYAVIEVGKNNYGHPADEVLDNLKKAGVTVLRTDQDGTVKFTSDGGSVLLK